MRRDQGATPTIVLMGAGNLATAVAHSLALVPHATNMKVVIVGRDSVAAKWIAASTSARAAAVGRVVESSAYAVRWDASETVAEALLQARPDLVVQLTSLQSPWTLAGDDAWSRLIREGGFGITAALQLPRLLTTLQAMTWVGLSAPVVNACFPDFTNVVACRLGYAVTCGIGNIGILAAFFATKLNSKKRLRMLANHTHVADCIRGQYLEHLAPIVFVGNRRLDTADVIRFSPVLPEGPELNMVAGATAVPVLLSLAGVLPKWRGHAPSPYGLPGGYPVRIEKQKIELDLPASISRSEAIAWNNETVMADGVVVNNGMVAFTEKAQLALNSVAPTFPQSFKLSEIEFFIDSVQWLRKKLISQ